MVIEKKSVDSRFTPNTNISPTKCVNSVKPNPLPVAKPLIDSANAKQKKDMKVSKNSGEKKVKPKIPKQSNPQSPLGDPHQVGYGYAGRETWIQFIRKNLPKELIPTNRTGYILGVVFLVVVIIALIQFPLGDLLSGNIEGLEVKVGIPWPLLIFDAFNPLEQPIQIKGLILDLIIYLAISYAIEILINVFLYSEFMKSHRQKRVQPKVFDLKGGSLSEKVTNKLLSDKPVPKKDLILSRKNDGKKFDGMTSVKKKG